MYMYYIVNLKIYVDIFIWSSYLFDLFGFYINGVMCFIVNMESYFIGG